MNDFTPEDADQLLDAAARGGSIDGHTELSEALSELHAPLPPAAGGAPSLAAGGVGGTGRFARRTAVAASLTVFSLVGVAAAGTAGIAILADDEPAVIEDDLTADEVPAETTTTTTTIAAADDPADEIVDDPIAPDVDDDEADDDGDESDRERGDEIEGVDASDGLDDTELELICEAAVNHGEYVSSVARDKQEGADQGARVSEAAGTDCGKDDVDDADDADDADDDDADDADDDADDADEDADDAGEADDDDRNGNGNGNGKAKGHEKNGKSDD